MKAPTNKTKPNLFNFRETVKPKENTFITTPTNSKNQPNLGIGITPIVKDKIYYDNILNQKFERKLNLDNNLLKKIDLNSMTTKNKENKIKLFKNFQNSEQTTNNILNKEPKTQKDSISPNIKISSKPFGIVEAYAATTIEGNYREYNEDRVSIILNISKPDNYNGEWPKSSFFGIYDGHGGSSCADFLRDYLHKFVLFLF